MSAPPSQSQLATTASLPCASCGYDVTGLPDDGLCPECATQIWLSRNTQTLWSVPPKARRGMRIGCLLMLFGHLTFAVITLPYLILHASTTNPIPEITFACAIVTYLAAFAATFGAALASLHGVYSTRENIMSPRIISLIGSCGFGVVGCLVFLAFLADAITNPLSFSTSSRSLAACYVLPILVCFSALFTFEWLTSIAHARTKLIQQISGRQPFRPWKQVVATALPAVLGPIGSAISAAYCFRNLRAFETLAHARTDPK